MSRANEGRPSKISVENDGVITCTGDTRPLKEYKGVFNISTDYVSSVTTEKSYTSFKWILNDYSLLEGCLSYALESPNFTLTDTNEQCQLIFEIDKGIIHLSLKIPRHITCEILQICFSIIDENYEKIVKSRLVLNPGDEANGGPYVVYNVALITANDIYYNEKCLVNDTLTLLCEIVKLDYINVSAINVHSSKIAHFDKNTCQKMEEYYTNKAFCDINLFVNEKQFRAHKLILATASPVFGAMFQANMVETEENTVRITDIDADVFEKFLKYLYVGKIENLDQVAVDLLIVAGKYQVPGLMDLCESFLISTIDLSNAIKRLLVAHQHNFKKLHDVALRFVRSNIHRLAEENNFKELCVYSDLLTEVLRKSN